MSGRRRQTLLDSVVGVVGLGHPRRFGRVLGLQVLVLDSTEVVRVSVDSGRRLPNVGNEVRARSFRKYRSPSGVAYVRMMRFCSSSE